MSYTSLKGFESISDTDLYSSIEANLISFFDWGFIDKGAFTNVRLSNSDIRGSNRSTLVKKKDPNYQDGRVWSTFKQNLVWESGLTFATQPIQISGVYVNGSFKTPTTAGYEHYVDYVNGDVIFNSAVTGTIKMEYSYKNVNITETASVPILKELQFRSNDLTDSNYISSSSGDWSRLGKIQLPVIAIEVTPESNFRPLELGNQLQYCDTTILCHVLSESKEIARKYSHIIGMQKDKTIYMYDLDMMAESGVFPLVNNTKHSGTMTYPQLVAENSYRYNKLRITGATVQGPFKLGNLYHSIVNLKTEVISIL